MWRNTLNFGKCIAISIYTIDIGDYETLKSFRYLSGVIIVTWIIYSVTFSVRISAVEIPGILCNRAVQEGARKPPNYNVRMQLLFHHVFALFSVLPPLPRANAKKNYSRINENRIRENSLTSWVAILACKFYFDLCYNVSRFRRKTTLCN